VESLVNGSGYSVKLLASYRDKNDQAKLADMDISVQDGLCGCPAKIANTGAATDWLTFQCHNLGGLDILTGSETLTQAHHGDWYRWGAPTASVQNLNAITDAPPSTSEWTYNDNGNGPAIPEYQDYNTHSTADWYAAKNPCPAGWRLPTNPEFAAAINKTTGNGNLGADNNTLAWPGTWSSSTSNFSALLKVGDYLYLPAAGFRVNSDGSLSYRGCYGHYWSSSAQSSDGRFVSFDRGNRSIIGINRGYGLSVRCVAAE
jgi:uncharacterized protein (TIGR02145 family)